MNLKMIRPEDQTEDLLLSITKNCETLYEQTHRKPEETLEFKMIQPREIFHFTPPVQIKRDWMIGLKDLEIYSSIFNITEENYNANFINFLMKKVVVSHIKKLEMRLKETRIFQIFQLLIY